MTTTYEATTWLVLWLVPKPTNAACCEAIPFIAPWVSEVASDPTKILLLRMEALASFTKLVHRP